VKILGNKLLKLRILFILKKESKSFSVLNVKLIILEIGFLLTVGDYNVLSVIQFFAAFANKNMMKGVKNV
jgi:hypothetical protein